MSDTVNIAGVKIGGKHRIAVQTMCNTHTTDIMPSVLQIREMAAAGADIIRLTTQGMREVEALKEISRIIREEGIRTPLVADIHFNSEVAMAAAEVAEKVRINPGNFAREFDRAAAQFRRLIGICRERGTVIRIGLNHGSLGERIIKRFGDTPLGMKEAVMEWIDIAHEEKFDDIVISMKASNTRIMVDAYRLLAEEMKRRGMSYPLHLGVTEAGNGDTGRIKSAVGVAALLQDGIGDTIRVSLTEDPVREIPAGQIIADYFDALREGKRKAHDFRTPARYTEKTWEEFIIHAACDFGPALLDRKIDDFTFSASVAGDEIGEDRLQEVKDEILQAARRKFTKPEYVACPGCGRTLYNLEKKFNEVKSRTSHLKGMTIAVMGCIVNGPGEMADAHYGYVGEGPGKVAIYRGKSPVLRGIPEDEAIDRLIGIIENDEKAGIKRD